MWLMDEDLEIPAGLPEPWTCWRLYTSPIIDCIYDLRGLSYCYPLFWPILFPGEFEMRESIFGPVKLGMGSGQAAT